MSLSVVTGLADIGVDVNEFRNVNQQSEFPGMITEGRAAPKQYNSWHRSTARRQSRSSSNSVSEYSAGIHTLNYGRPLMKAIMARCATKQLSL